jgi:uncharacterized Zn finger protein
MSFYSRRSFFNYTSASEKRVLLRKAKERYSKLYELKGVSISGRRDMANTFWGKMWCEHFETMADFTNRLPRGRTYARNGSIIHLDISPGKVFALVSGTEIYEINMEVQALPKNVWTKIVDKCHGEIGTMIDLMNGHFSKEVMQVICDPQNGLFPRRNEIKYKCSCPDVARLCKHLSAVFYGIGNRLDSNPELLFLLRQVDPTQLLTLKMDQLTSKGADNLTNDELSEIFGIQLETEINDPTSPSSPIAEKLPEPAKKKPGRPKKTGKSVSLQDKIASFIESTSSDTSTKKKRGRPKESEKLSPIDKIIGLDDPTKKKRGRPAGARKTLVIMVKPQPKKNESVVIKTSTKTTPSKEPDKPKKPVTLVTCGTKRNVLKPKNGRKNNSAKK